VKHTKLSAALVGSVFLAGALGACTDTGDIDDNDEPTGNEVVYHHGPPDPDDVAFANAVADAMLDRILAALLREFAVTTAENAPVGTVAISNIFDNDNKSMRLVGEEDPLQNSNRPKDDFERDALEAALQGLPFERTERVHGKWYVRKSFAVSNDFSTSCVHCHANFVDLDNPWVGALMVRARVDD
jgi:hypothetical protein